MKVKSKPVTKKVRIIVEFTEEEAEAFAVFLMEEVTWSVISDPVAHKLVPALYDGIISVIE